MSGDIAVSDNEKYEILHRTLNECIDKGWVTANRFGAGFNKVSVTDAGGAMATS